MTTPAGSSGVQDGPNTAAIQAAMRDKGVETVSQLHDLLGKTVVIGDYFDRHYQETFAGGPATVFYAVGDLFMARMENGREPSGSISAIVTAPDGTLSYAFPEGA